MKLKTVGSNQTEVQRGEITVFYSYSTPVAVLLASKATALTTAQHYSRTTSKHITQALSRWGVAGVCVPQAEIDALAA